MGTRQLLQAIGGAKRDRTADLLHAMQALSQLSYSPTAGANYRTRRALLQTCAWLAMCVCRHRARADLAIALRVFRYHRQPSLAFRHAVANFRIAAAGVSSASRRSSNTDHRRK